MRYNSLKRGSNHPRVPTGIVCVAGILPSALTSIWKRLRNLGEIKFSTPTSPQEQGKQMTDNLNLTSETALKTLYTNLYPSLSEEHLPTSDPTPLEETHVDFINNPAVSAARHKFLTSWKASVELETSYQAEVKKAQTTRLLLTNVAQLDEERKKAHKETTNNLNLYVYTVVKDKLEPPGGTLVPESIQEAIKTLKNYIKSLNGKEENVHSLIQLLHIVHGKQREFTTELIAALQREALLQHVDLGKTNNDLLRDEENLVTKLKTATKKLERGSRRQRKNRTTTSKLRP